MSETAWKRSLKDQFVDEVTRGVLSGKYPIGEKLPSERDLAAQMGISRTVVRSGLAELVANGIVELYDRRGYLVANGIVELYDRRGYLVVDYRLNGTMPIIDAILTGCGDMSQQLLEDFLKARVLLASETARLAALNRTNADLYQMFTIIREATDLPEDDVAGLAQKCFQLHRQIAAAGKNTIYPVLLNCMEPTYRTLLEQNHCRELTKMEIMKMEELLYEAIQDRDPDRAVARMLNICTHRMP